MEGGLLSLRWNDHGHTFFDMLSTIRRKEAYCDVTLVCDGRFYPVHKLVLSTCSDFFDHLFRRTDCKHPVVIVANVFHKDLEALLNYMYLGEVNVLQTELTSLMKAAEVLRIKGLAEPTKAPTKETRENKRSLSGEGTDSSVKRKRSEDIASPSARRSSPLALNKTAAKEPSRSRVGNDSQTSKNSDQVNAPQSSSSCSSSATGSQHEQLPTSKVLPNVSQSTHQEPLVSPQNSPTEQESGSKAVRPEVKVEEILIKDEPGSWFGESDEGLDNLQFSETDPTLDYNSQTAASYSGNCLPWELAAAGTTQPHPVEGHFPQGMPGSSGMQGMAQADDTMAYHPTFKTTQRGMKLNVDGFSYTQERSREFRGYWRCPERGCPGRCVLLGYEVIRARKHNHPPHPSGKTTSGISVRPNIDL